MPEWRETRCYKYLKKELKNSYRYYFEKGNNQYKKDYKTIFYAILDYKKSVKLALKDLKYYEQIYNECICDNPLFFYVKTVSFFIGSLGINIIIYYAYEWNEVEKIYTCIFSELKKIKKLCKDMSESEKLMAIHDYIVSSVVYEDNPNLPVHLADSFFVYKKAVCDGISKAAKILLDSAGVKSIVIWGDALTPNSMENSSLGHAWNIVWVAGISNHVDFTFDTNLSSEKRIIRYDYYRLTDEQIRHDHTYSDIGIVSNHNHDWFRENKIYFTKKEALKSYIREEIKTHKKDIGFRLPYTENSKYTLDSILNLVKNEIQLNSFGAFSYSVSVNETQMIVYIYL